MRKLFILCAIAAHTQLAYSQTDSLTKTRWVAGFGFPELLHGGLRFDITRLNQIGFSAGFVPNFDEIVSSLSIEHRIYFARIHSRKTNWFTRQSFSFLSDRDGGLLAFTVGTDLRSRSGRAGWTFDAGIDFPVSKEEDDRDFYGALRIQYYHYFKKRK